MARHDIPQYYVYGEPVRALDAGFMHVELVSARNNRHRGRVAAHTHPQLAQITYWTKGGGTYQIEDRAWAFSAPAISFVPSGTVHGFSVRPASDAIVVSIASDALAAVTLRHAAPALKPVFIDRQTGKGDWQVIGTTMHLLLREHASMRNFHASVMSHLAGVVLAYIARHQNAAEGLVPARLPLAQRLQQLVDRNFRENHAVDDYITTLNSTRHLLDKAAKAAFGMPVKQLILQRRLLEARRLLQFTIRTSEDISHELGFTDPAYFNREFRKHMGLSPGAWRRQRR